MSRLSKFLLHLRAKRRRSVLDRYQVGRCTYGAPTIRHWDEPATLRIGAFCSIAEDVTIFLGGNHRSDWVTTYPFPSFRESVKNVEGHTTTKGDVVIGNDVWIGEGATILSGVNIGNGAVIGTRSVVARDVPPYGIVVGNPARLVRRRFADDDIALLERIAWWEWPDAELERAMPLLLSGNVKGLGEFAATILTLPEPVISN